jgi:hypothetical protein
MLLVGNGAGGPTPGGGINLLLLRPEDCFRYELSMIRLGIDELIHVRPCNGRPVSNQAAGITLWLSRNMLAGS